MHFSTNQTQFLPNPPAFGVPLGVMPLEFCRRNFLHHKTRLPGLLCGIACVILCLALLLQLRLVTYVQKDA